MSNTVFSFDGNDVRVVGTSSDPLFVVKDVCVALGHSNSRQAIRDMVSPEDVVKVSIPDSFGRKQVMNAINESGLYCLIFGSKLEKAREFKRWVTSEVLPSIRKTGRYELPTDTITNEQQLAIRNAVASRARNHAVHYQTIYHALYDHFQIPRYQELRKVDFDRAIEFIKTCNVIPQLNGSQSARIPEGSIVLDRVEAERLRTFVYYIRYLYRPTFESVHKLLKVVESPLAGRFWDVVNELNFSLLENTLDKNGYSVKSLPSYQQLINHS